MVNLMMKKLLRRSRCENKSQRTAEVDCGVRKCWFSPEPQIDGKMSRADVCLGERNFDA